MGKELEARMFADLKPCRNCGTYAPLDALECRLCGADFPPPAATVPFAEEAEATEAEARTVTADAAAPPAAPEAAARWNAVPEGGPRFPLSPLPEGFTLPPLEPKNAARPVAPEAAAGSRTNVLAICSLLLGVASYPLCALGWLSAPVGLLLGLLALRRCRRDPAMGGRRLALVGVGASAVFLIVATLIVNLAGGTHSGTGGGK